MTPFLVKLDEHLGKATLQLLREGSYDVDTVLDERLSGSSDERRVLAERSLEDLRGCLAVADERGTRVRWPLVET